MAVGKKEFIEFALKRHRELKHKNIPLLRAAKKKDLFNGNIANPGEFIAVYIIIAIGAALLFGIMLFIEFSPQTPETDLRYSTVAFNSCEVYGDELWLRTGGDMDYKIAHYDEVLPDVDAFLAKYKNGGVLKLGYQSVSPRHDPDYYRVYYARGAANEMFVTQEKECEVRARHTKEERPKIIALFSALMLFLLSIIPGSIYAGVPAKFVKKVDPEQAKEINQKIAKNYHMYSSWYKEEH